MDGVLTHPVPAAPQSSQHFTRSQTRLHYKAAGVLPFSFQYGVPVVLLGAELAKTGPQGKIYKTMWRDFGGQREAIDPDSETTASREFAEETMGLFGGCGVNESSVAACSKQMHAQLTQRQHVLKVVHQLKKGEYHMYVAQTPHIDPLMFHLALQQNAETDAVDGAEKTAFAWVTLSDLLAATSTCAKRYFLCAHVHTTGNRRQPVVHGPRRMQLHPCFANSLRLAQDAGLLALVAAANMVPATAALPVDNDRLNLVSRTKTVLPVDSSLAACHQSASVRQSTAVLATDADESGAHPPARVWPGRALAIDQEELPAAAAGPSPGKCKQPQAARRRKKNRHGSSTGVTPEHMLYWVSQADVAAQLRCTDSACSAAAVLLPEAALTEGPTQEACASSTPGGLLPAWSAEEQCNKGCHLQSSRASEMPSAAGTVHCTVKPVVLHKPVKRKHC